MANKKLSSHFALLHYVLQLFFGGIFLITLLEVVHSVVYAVFFPGVLNWPQWNGEVWAITLATLLLSGAGHIFIIQFFPHTKSDFTPLAKRAQKVLQIAFVFCLTMASLGFAVRLISTPLVAILNPEHLTAGGFFAPVITSIISLSVISIMLMYHVDNPKKAAEHFYPAIIATFAIIFVILFVAIPAQKAYKEQQSNIQHDDTPAYEQEPDEYQNCPNPEGIFFPGEVNCIYD